MQINPWSSGNKFYGRTRVSSIIFGRKQWFHVWRKINEQFEDRHLQKTMKQGGGNIMVWSCFSWEEVDQLVKIGMNGIMTADIYIDILHKNLEVSLIQLGLENKFIL